MASRAQCPVALVAVVLALRLAAPEARLGASPEEGDAAAEVKMRPAPPALCAGALVAETCAVLGGGGGATTPGAVAEVLAATPKAVAGLWAAEKLPEGAAVQCDALCRGTTAVLERLGRHVPPASDTGCYDRGGDLVCDLDLSPSAIRTAAASNTGDFAFTEDLRGLGVPTGGNESLKEAEALESKVFEYDVEDLAVRVAQLFRIYPALGRGVVVDDLPAAKGGDVSPELLQQRLSQSIAYVSLSIRTFPDHGTRTQVAMYFGDAATSDGASRQKVLSVLNSISNVLSYSRFYQGPDCSPRTFGYVYPCRRSRLERDASGRFMIFLCSMFWSTKDEQICTLVHEASHHATACTKDLMYGASQCRTLAQQNPSHALVNADNYGYYIREVAASRGVH